MDPELSGAGVEVGLLGPVTLTVDGNAVPVPGLRRRAVLAVLAAAAAAVPADHLAEAVWSDTGTPSARSTLHVHVHQLRQALGPHAATLQHTPAGYRLHGAASDVRAAEERLRRARAADRAGDAEGASALYRAGLALWRGTFCADLADLEYFRAARAFYDTVRLDAVEAAIAADLRTGREGLVAELEALVGEHPLRERLWGQLMVALYRADRQADALGAYRRARAVLAAETGLDPGAALRGLEQAILDRAGTTELLRVVAPGPTAAGRPVLTWLDAAGGTRTRELPAAGEIVLGRDVAADVPLVWDAAVSRRHAAVVVAGATLQLQDRGSRNGTFRNGVRVGPEGAPLRAGDLVRCGDTILVVGGPGRRAAAPSPDDDTRTGGG